MSLQEQVTRLVEASNQLTEAVHKAVDDLPELCAAVAGSPVLARAFVQDRAAMWPGHTAADGQELEREHYPAAWAAIRDRKVPVCSDEEFLANPEMRGFFTEGNGVTTFRVPDYNGMMPDSLAAAFFRGDGKNSTGVCGKVQGDAIRDINGEFFISPYSHEDTPIVGTSSGALNVEKAPPGSIIVGALPVNGSGFQANVSFAASRVVPTGPENRPVAVTGCWAVKLFGVVQNVGEVDAMSLMTRVAELEAWPKLTRYEVEGQSLVWSLEHKNGMVEQGGIVGPIDSRVEGHRVNFRIPYSQVLSVKAQVLFDGNRSGTQEANNGVVALADDYFVVASGQATDSCRFIWESRGFK